MHLKWLVAGAGSRHRIQAGARRHDHRRHLVPEGADRRLQDGLREEVPERQGRDPQQGHLGRHRLRARAGRRQPRRRSSGPRRPTPSRCSPRRSCCRRSTWPTTRHPGQDRQLSDQRSRGPLPRPGARRLRPHVEHALHAGATSCRRRRSGPTSPSRSTSATSRPRAPSRSGTTHLTFETILQGEGWDKGWNQILQIAGNCAADHRAQLRRARRRAERPVRHRPGDRLLRPRRQELGLPGRVRLSERDRDRAGQHRAGRRREEPRRRASASCSSRCRRKASSCCSTRRSRACRCCRRPTPRRPPGYPNPFSGTIQAKVNFDSDLSESRYYVVLVAVRPGRSPSATRSCRRRPRRSRTPRSASAAKPSAQLDEAKQARLARRRSTTKQAKDKELLAVFKAKKGDDAALRRKTAGRGGVEQQGQGQLRPRRRARQRRRSSAHSPVLVAVALAIAAFLAAFLVAAGRERDLHRVRRAATAASPSAHFATFFADLADARVVLQQPLRRRAVGGVRLADRGAARLLHGALPSSAARC